MSLKSEVRIDIEGDDTPKTPSHNPTGRQLTRRVNELFSCVDAPRRSTRRIDMTLSVLATICLFILFIVLYCLPKTRDIALLVGPIVLLLSLGLFIDSFWIHKLRQYKLFGLVCLILDIVTVILAAKYERYKDILVFFSGIFTIGGLFLIPWLCTKIREFFYRQLDVRVGPETQEHLPIAPNITRPPRIRSQRLTKLQFLFKQFFAHRHARGLSVMRPIRVRKRGTRL